MLILLESLKKVTVLTLCFFPLPSVIIDFVHP
jgi:hypothetical protein